MGRDHEHDDNGLPPADDVVVPDDARELEREIQAYHRELRWHHRSERWRALFTFFRRHGTLVPLLAGVLLLTAISAALLMLSTRPDTEGFDSSASTPPGQDSRSGSRDAIGAPVADIPVWVNGHRRKLSALHPAVLTLVPAGCACSDAVQTLATSARHYGIPVYLVESGRRAPELEQLASRLGQRHHPAVIEEPTGKIARTYGGSGLEAVLVSHDGRVSTVLDKPALRSQPKLARHLAPLRGSWESSGNSAGSSIKPGV